MKNDGDDRKKGREHVKQGVQSPKATWGRRWRRWQGIILIGAMGWGLSAQQPTADDSVTLQLRREPEGIFLPMQEFFALLESLLPGARARWDPVGGLMRIDQGATRIEAYRDRAWIRIDNQTRAVKRPMLTRQGNVLLPIETVEITLRELGVDFELTEQAAPQPAATPTPSPSPTAPAAVLPPDVILTLTPTPTPTPTATPSATPTPLPASAQDGPIGPAPGTPEPGGAGYPMSAAKVLREALPSKASTPLSEAERAALPLLMPGGGESPAGLRWSQIRDEAHRFPPRRMTLVCDAALQGFAERVAAIAQGGAYPVNVEVVIARQAARDSSELCERAMSSAPDLVLDLMADPSSGSGEVILWIANDALWPQDRERQGSDEAGASAQYRRHQFQSMALATQLRHELGRTLGEQRTRMELAPIYTLRRMDAPAAAAWFGSGVLAEARDAEQAESLAAAVAAGVAAYVKGMSGF